MNKAQRLELFAIRKSLDSLVQKIVEQPEEINDNMVAIRTWKPYTSYMRNDVRIDPADNIPYWAMHDHTSVDGQELQPSLTPSIWAHYHGTTPETARPFIQEGHNPYMTNHYCIENEIVYRCTYDNVIYAPSVYPQVWEQV